MFSIIMRTLACACAVMLQECILQNILFSKVLQYWLNIKDMVLFIFYHLGKVALHCLTDLHGLVLPGALFSDLHPVGATLRLALASLLS